MAPQRFMSCYWTVFLIETLDFQWILDWGQLRLTEGENCNRWSPWSKWFESQIVTGRLVFLNSWKALPVDWNKSRNQKILWSLHTVHFDDFVLHIVPSSVKLFTYRCGFPHLWHRFKPSFSTKTWFFHIFVEEFTEFTTNPMSKPTGFSQHDLRELHAFFEVEKTCAARLRKEMHGVVWRMEMVAVSENVHFRRSNFAGIVME